MSDDGSEIAYATWGETFFEQAVTAERVLAGVNVLAGQPIDVGPIGVGPGRIVKVLATGAIGTAVGERVSAAPVSFRVALPVSLEFTIDLGMDKHRFTADLSVPLVITARARADLSILLDVTPPSADQVVVRLKATSLRASITQHAAGVEGELKRFVSKYVAREVEKPYVASARTIDVAGAIEKAMSHVAPQRRDDTVSAVTADFDRALEAEIDQRQEMFADLDVRDATDQ